MQKVNEDEQQQSSSDSATG